MGTVLEQDSILQVTELTKDALQKISEMHKSMYGVNHVKFVKMYSYFVKHIQDFYEELIHDCLIKVENLEKEAENKYLELDNLQKELNMNNFEVTFDKSEPLTAIIDKVEKSLIEYRSIKAERIEALNALLEKESELCRELNAPSFPPISGIPSEELINELKQHVNKLQTEKLNRVKTYRITKQSIISLMKELEFDHLQPIHNEIMNSNEETYNLTPDFMDKMKNLEDDLKNLLEDATKTVEYLKDKLNKLWDRIKIEESHKMSFLSNIKGVGRSFQDLLKNELVRCEEIKQANIKPVIMSVRDEINEMWDKLTYTEEEKQQFITYYSDTYSDDVLTLHEMELLKLKTIYEDNKHIFDLAEKRESLWRRMQQLDEVASDKNRFKNRGGQLLKEERERKILETNVPKTDAQLKSYLNQYQEKNGKCFLWHGQDLLQKIAVDWETRLKSKEKNKTTKPHRALKRKTPIKCRDQYIPSSSGNKDASMESLETYSVFQEQIEVGSNSVRKRDALKEINSPLRAHSSPTSSPKKFKKTPVTPNQRRKCMVTPGKWR
ncbi:protein regulator of cytokinesis 1-like isoform X2 [Rhodnius prolixus]|uniref:protein regulator of cytokinesis 1-like isoform X2 n=1 Tax=Rhodnius prolixus TaxID=13249 RepID=UPI003D1896CB